MKPDISQKAQGFRDKSHTALLIIVGADRLYGDNSRCFSRRENARPNVSLTAARLLAGKRNRFIALRDFLPSTMTGEACEAALVSMSCLHSGKSPCHAA